MCDMCAYALRVERVGLMVDFFEIEGHSMAAMQLVQQLSCGVHSLMAKTTVDGLLKEMKCQKKKLNIR